MSERRTNPGGRPMVRAVGLRKRFGGADVLDRVDLEVAPGEFVCVTGPSGSGKSTLIHLLAALDRPDEGTVEVAGFDTHHRAGAARFRRRDIGIVFQLHNLLPTLTAVENVEIALIGTHTHRRARVERAHRLLEELALGELAEQHPPTMSGGERQRVAIARALANDPAVLLADEPTSSLDDDSAEIALDVLDHRREETGLTIVAVSHDARLLARADRILRLADGHLTEGPTSDPLPVSAG